MKNLFRSKDSWTTLIIVLISILVAPIMLIILVGIFCFDLRLELSDFVSSWIALWAAIAVICSIYNIKIALDKKIDDEWHHKELRLIKQVQLDLQREQLELNSYYKCIEFLMSSDEVIRITAITNLHILAKQYPDTYRDKICNLFCELVKSYAFTVTNFNSKMPRYINLILKILFAPQSDNVFYECHKNLNNCILHRALLSKAVVNNASFNNASFLNCCFHGTEIMNSEFIVARFESCVVRTCNIKDSNFNRSRLLNMNFDRGCLKNSQFSQSSISNSQFIKCNFLADSFDGGTITNSDFNGCKFNNACILSESTLKNIVMNFSNEEKLHRVVGLLSDAQKSTTTISFPYILINPIPDTVTQS